MEFQVTIDIDEEKLRERIKGCQHMNHVQQVAFSTYHNCLTQICFTCKKIRTSLNQIK